jgi:hypothetical protein
MALTFALAKATGTAYILGNIDGGTIRDERA